MDGFDVAALVLAAAAALIVRWATNRLPGPDSSIRPAVRLDEYDLAYLKGGRERAVGAAIGSLAYRGLLTADTANRTLAVAATVPGMAHPMERAIHAAASPSAARVDRIVRAVTPETDQIERRLVELRLLRSRDAYLCMAALTTAVFVAVLVGAEFTSKVAGGQWLHSCVVVLGLPAAMALSKSAMRQTPEGQRLLREAEHEAEPAKLAVAHHGAGVTGSAVACAIGLFGSSVLVGTPLSDLARLIQPRKAGDCGACGACGGCGGCGGDGCGGCGE